MYHVACGTVSHVAQINALSLLSRVIELRIFVGLLKQEQIMERRKREIFQITLVGTLVNLLLVALKFVGGIVGRSGAMVADAVHSLSDLLTDVVVLVFVHLSSKPKDTNHAYGHGKFETLSTTIISVILLAVGLGIFWEGGLNIWKAMHGEVLESPGMIALGAAVVSILAKEVLYRYTVVVGKRVNSPSVVANAWHHRSDAFSSIGTGIGIAGAIFLGESWRILDPIAAIVVSVFIVRVSFEMMIPTINELLEGSLPETLQQEILDIIGSVDEVEIPHNLRTRTIGGRFAIEVHICVDAQKTVAEAHRITQVIERRLFKQYGDETHITIHVEPAKQRIV